VYRGAGLQQRVTPEGWPAGYVAQMQAEQEELLLVGDYGSDSVTAWTWPQGSSTRLQQCDFTIQSLFLLASFHWRKFFVNCEFIYIYTF
jgi:hypothetical protein